MNTSKLIFFDYETAGVDFPDRCEPVELAAVIIEPRTLEIVDSFQSFMKPEIWDDPYVQRSTVEWHANKVNKKPDEIIELWKTYPNQKEVWERFVGFLAKHNENPAKPTPFKAPIPIGHNNINFDMPITTRLCKLYGNVDKYGQPNIWNKKDKLDLRHILFLYFENRSDLTSYAFDNVREYFGMSKEGAHTGKVDVEQGAALFIRFLKLTRRTSERTDFQGKKQKQTLEEVGRNM